MGRGYKESGWAQWREGVGMGGLLSFLTVHETVQRTIAHVSKKL